jgi:hypothetical protein
MRLVYENRCGGFIKPDKIFKEITTSQVFKQLIEQQTTGNVLFYVENGLNQVDYQIHGGKRQRN